jgi:hypothetical protein
MVLGRIAGERRSSLTFAPIRLPTPLDEAPQPDLLQPTRTEFVLEFLLWVVLPH